MKKYIIIIMILMNNNVFAQEQISNLVVPVSYFINHVSQLEKLKDNLNKYTQSSIVGVSGMGKTQLARMYAYENKTNYDLIWFIDCNLDINQQLIKLAKSINNELISPVISEDVAVIRKELISYLSSKNRWLLVFDNLKIKENKKVEDFVNWEHNGNIIFCSQDSEILQHIVRISAFNKIDSVTLAKSILESKDSKSIEFLVQEFGGYPILIVQGAQLLNQVQGLKLKEYKKMIQQSDDKIELNIKLGIEELKQSARNLLNKIALINNQSFSKELLSIITDSKDDLDDDIYQLSKFAMISNTDNNDVNPIFEMHDIIAQKIVKINDKKINKICLEDIIVKLVNARPKSTIKSLVFSSTKTLHENLEIILDNAQKYDLNIHKVIKLSIALLADYLNSEDYNNAEKQISWFVEQEKKNQLKQWLMNNDEKATYAMYLSNIGIYQKCALCNNQKAIEYFIRALKALPNTPKYDNKKFHILCCLAGTQLKLGQLHEAKENIEVIKEMFNNGLIDKNDIGRISSLSASLLFRYGKYDEALIAENKAITSYIETGLDPNNLVFTDPYLLKAEILNCLGKYKEAYAQAKQIYNMHAAVKQEDHSIFGQIFTQISRADLGLGNAKEALEYARKAKTIFINDPARPNKEIIVSPDIYLAKAFVAEGNALTVLSKNEEAVESYATAENIYWNNYRDNMKNIDEISIMYLAATKASCSITQKFWYNKFYNKHIEKFGTDHPRSIEILNLKCRNSNY